MVDDRLQRQRARRRFEPLNRGLVRSVVCDSMFVIGVFVRSMNQHQETMRFVIGVLAVLRHDVEQHHLAETRG